MAVVFAVVGTIAVSFAGWRRGSAIITVYVNENRGRSDLAILRAWLIRSTGPTRP